MNFLNSEFGFLKTIFDLMHEISFLPKANISSKKFLNGGCLDVVLVLVISLHDMN